MKKISLFLLVLSLVSGSSLAQWSEVPAAWTEIQIAPGDITGVTITTTSPLTGGSACTTGACAFTLGLGVVPATLGGTGQSSFTIGDMIYASSTTAISKLGIGTNGQCLVVTAGLPAWGTCAAGGSGITSIDGLTDAAQLFARTNDTNVTLTLGTSGTDTHTFTMGWTGTLGVSRGGTALASGTSGGILGYTDSGTLASSVALTANALVLGGGAGATPTPLGSLGTTTTILHGNAAGAPTWASVSLTADVTGTLPVANGGSGIATTTAYSLVMSGTTATGTWNATIGPGTATQVLTSNGAGAYPTWQAPAGGISGLTTGRVPYAASSTTLADSAAFVASVANDTVPHWFLTSLFAGKPGMTIEGAASQTANLLRFQNSAHTVLAYVDAAGRPVLPGSGVGVSLGGVSSSDPGLRKAGAIQGHVTLDAINGTDTVYGVFQAWGYSVEGQGFIQANGNGGIAATYGTAGTAPTSISQSRGVYVSTAGSGAPLSVNANLLAGWVITNEGATAQQYSSLPTAVAGLTHTFYVQDSDGMRITAAAGDTIRIAASVSATAGYIDSTTVGDSITLVAVNATEWVAVAKEGAGWAVH